jgi:hypothetical protein
MKVITAENKGFYACVLDTLRHIYHCENDGEGFRVRWGPESLYYDASKGVNAWEYFFEQPTCEVKYLSGYPPAREVHGYIEIPETGHDFRATMYKLIQKYLRYQDDVIPYIDGLFSNWPVSHNVIGVHVRFTDKYNWRQYGEPEAAKPIDINTYLTYTEKQFNTTDANYIFLASDNIEAVNAFSARFGNRLICTNCPRSTGSEAIHSGMKHISGKTKGISVIVDVEGLSRCNFLIRSTSNVGSFAQFMNLDLEHINLNEVLQGDKRELEYGLKSYGSM